MHTPSPICRALQVIQPPLGVALVAAKAHYFGVGGGIKTFKKAVKQDGIFEVPVNCIAQGGQAVVAACGAARQSGGCSVAWCCTPV